MFDEHEDSFYVRTEALQAASVSHRGKGAIEVVDAALLYEDYLWGRIDVEEDEDE